MATDRIGARDIIQVNPVTYSQADLVKFSSRKDFSAASCILTWIRVDKKEYIFLNDFRWNDKIIPWHDLLYDLKGHLYTLST